ncbi:type II toxin-antitoxin system RelE/ParE family toxin [Aquimarina sp. ERC-38]|uniref:type II toxin-antitoxin system RelE/ParE family toxin n=1 Tax=Aquimarina sp. ERC-38 TaxID=2949996 RepID=UPI00224709E7|nr:type II toxin-antitoxin system RelE/ParE family toxin [Aquimarina sp. ERC-38]UZO81341.1 type II toxin-antitoxin system RelE/ParE family toxin [Aquimarina sp. ERC-38]
MGNYRLSSKSEADLVNIYKFGIKHFGPDPATIYLTELESFIEELASRPDLARDGSLLATSLKFYRYKAHVIFYKFLSPNTIYVVRILGKRMDFISHL